MADIIDKVHEALSLLMNEPYFKALSVEYFLPHMLFTFSQSGEDIVVRNNLVPDPGERGIFIDIGAYHPVRFSNTFALYLCGWRGVSIDANVDAISEFNRVRPEDTNVHLAVAPSQQKLYFTSFEEGAYNTLKLTPQNLETAVIRSPVRGMTEIECVGVNEVLETYASGKKFDFLNMDIEGMDLAVFQAIDFTRFRPRIIAAEFDHPVWVTYEFLKKLGKIDYEICCQCGNTTILINRDPWTPCK